MTRCMISILFGLLLGCSAAGQMDFDKSDPYVQPAHLYNPANFDLDKADITYYAFFDGYQMIVISTERQWRLHTLKMYLPPISSIHPIEIKPQEVYIFRDTTGKIRHQHQTAGHQFLASDFLPVDEMDSVHLHPQDQLFYRFHDSQSSYGSSSFGIMNNKGEILVEPKYGNQRQLPNGNYAMISGYHVDLFDSTYKQLYPFSLYMRKGRFEMREINPIVQNKKWGLADSSCNVLVPCIYDYQIPYDPNKPFKVTKDEVNGIMLPDFKVLFPLESNFIHPFNEYGLAQVRYNRKQGYVDTAGVLVTPIIYDNITEFYDGMSMVRKGVTYGFIDSTGRLAIDLDYEGAELFSWGVAAVCKKGKWGYVNRKGEVVIDFKYQQANRFNVLTGKAKVWKKDPQKCDYMELDIQDYLPQDTIH